MDSAYNTEEIKSKILKIFKEARQSPNGFFEESHFMDFLTSPPQDKNTIKNSFSGVKKYYRFMDCIELEFGICFKLPDLDRYYSVDKLVNKIKERLNKGRGNIQSVNHRLSIKETYWIEIILGGLATVIIFWLSISIISALISFGLVFAIYWILISKIRSRKHGKKLLKKITSTHS